MRNANDGSQEAEIDELVLTNNGILILEVKNCKERVNITPEGRIEVNGMLAQ